MKLTFWSYSSAEPQHPYRTKIGFYEIMSHDHTRSPSNPTRQCWVSNAKAFGCWPWSTFQWAMAEQIGDHSVRRFGSGLISWTGIRSKKHVHQHVHQTTLIVAHHDCSLWFTSLSGCASGATAPALKEDILASRPVKSKQFVQGFQVSIAKRNLLLIQQIVSGSFKQNDSQQLD